MNFRNLALVAVVGLVGCGGSSSGGGVMSLAGGRGTAGPGGLGGNLDVLSAGGQVTVAAAGTMPAPAAWSYVAPPLGANPRTITTTTSLTATGGTILGDDGANPATGLRVAAGAVLTLEPDLDGDASVGSDRVTLSLSDGLIIEGTLQFGRANGGNDAAAWIGTVGALAVRPGGTLRATGVDGSTTVDGSAGGQISLTAFGGCTMEGTLDTRGGKGKAGGAGGHINVEVGTGAVVVSGLATSDGGQGLAGFGGNAGGTEIWGRWSLAGTCNFRNTGSMLARGGAGTAGGGDGAWTYGSSCQTGQSYTSGVIDTSGGDATVDGPGGTAGECEYDAANGVLLVTGRILAKGGKGAGSGVGGGGNWCGVGTSVQASATGVDVSTYVGATVDVAGGEGTTGGDGGSLQVWDGNIADGTNGVTLFGSSGYDLRGGPGTSQGGTGGLARIVGGLADDIHSGTRIGGVAVSVPIDARGADASAGAGGDGGEVDLLTDDQGTPASRAVPSVTRKVTFSAPLQVTGGAGTSSGGAGGIIQIFEHYLVDAGAAIEASGGPGGSGAGGAGGTVGLTCDTAVRAGAVTANGGASRTAAGGQGGAVTLTSTGVATVRSGAVSVKGGLGPTVGTVGTVALDGAAATLVDGQLKP